MKFLTKLFYKLFHRKSIPDHWCGRWFDKNHKQLIIEKKENKKYVVTVLDKNYQPYDILLLKDKINKTEKLEANFTVDIKGYPILQVEAGESGIGPTYDLYFTKYSSGKHRLASNFTSLNQVRITPNVGMGLYDDFEDNLGVPWAFPLEDFIKDCSSSNDSLNINATNQILTLLSLKLKRPLTSQEENFFKEARSGMAYELILASIESANSTKELEDYIAKITNEKTTQK